MLCHPMELDIKRLLGHFVRDESGQEVLDDFLGQPGEHIEGRYVEDFRPSAVGVSLVHK